jgi:hypothetical protein
VFLKTLNALCVCLQYKHPRSIKRVIRSGKPMTLVFPVKSQKCDFGAESRCRLFATSAGKGLKQTYLFSFCTMNGSLILESCLFLTFVNCSLQGLKTDKAYIASQGRCLYSLLREGGKWLTSYR